MRIILRGGKEQRILYPGTHLMFVGDKVEYIDLQQNIQSVPIIDVSWVSV